MPLPNGLITYGPNANCTLELCKAEWSVVGYQPNVPANAFFLAAFAASALIHLAQGIFYWRKGRPTWGFTTVIVTGCLDEIVGYIGRLLLHDNPFSFGAFLMQIICVTTAPVFFCAAIYVTLSQTIYFIDPSKSRFDPRWFYWVFIPCDIISLVLQAAGGAMSSVSTTEAAVNRGVDISLAGLVFQVVTLVAFSALFIDYLWSCGFLGALFGGKAKRAAAGEKAAAAERSFPRPLRLFLVFLFLATLFIFIRCAYRVKELSEGYFSEFFREETLFIVLESVMMVIATYCLNVAQPGHGFQTAVEAPGSGTGANGGVLRGGGAGEDNDTTDAAAGDAKAHRLLDSSSDGGASRV